jgi:hypothetical protein
MHNATNRGAGVDVVYLPARHGKPCGRMCPGATAERIEIAGHAPFESRYCGQLHWLSAHAERARQFAYGG